MKTRDNHRLPRRRLLMAAAALALGAAAPGVAMAHEAENDIIGSWSGLIVATNPPAGQGNNLMSVHPGGIIVESRRYFVTPTPWGNLFETTGHGVWKRTGRRAFDVFIRILLQHADTGLAFGVDDVRLSLRLSRGGDTLTGTFAAPGPSGR